MVRHDRMGAKKKTESETGCNFNEEGEANGGLGIDLSLEERK